LPSAGKLRTVNIRKREWVLKDDSVTYGDAATIKQSLIRDFIDEREFDYGGKTSRKIIPHFARFIAQIWQVHPFGEGNTRTTAVFAIKYLRSLGFSVDNDAFRDNAWYFRNALVRANYADYAREVSRDWSYLEIFFRNLLLGEKNEMKSRYLLIGLTEEDKQKIRELTEEKGGPKKAVGKSGKKSGKKKVVGKSGKKTVDRVWALLQERPQSTFADMVRVLGITRSTIQKHIANLKAAGRLRRVGPDKGGHWEVI
jgi:fido (protein-threonine AMPylation protein)